MLIVAFALLSATQTNPFDPGPKPMLMRTPTINATSIVFEYAGDLWSVPRGGGSASRLTSNPGNESHPHFSPDGKWIAFAGQYDGNEDVFVMPAAGGEPKRLTAHPSPEVPVGWTPDGKSVLITSSMLSNTDLPRLFSVPVAGGVPKPLPLPSGVAGTYSPDGEHIAYVPGIKWEDAWKRYRGGQADKVWIAKLSDSSWKSIPSKNENDFEPMWIGDTIYFLSDKRGPVGLYSYSTKTGAVTEEVKGEGFDLKSASAGPGVIVYERLGSIYTFDISTHRPTRVNIDIAGDFPEVRSEFKQLNAISGLSIAPSGQRLAVTARGHLFSVPAAKGDARSLSEGIGIDRRDPAWSPDGRKIAYLTDEHLKQEVVILDLSTNKETFLQLGEAPCFYETLVWSPDSSKIAYTDRRHKVWFIDTKSAKNTYVDAGTYTDPQLHLEPKWSPDSKWLTWSRDLDNHLSAVFLFSVDSGKVTRVTDGMANAKSPVFDRSGKYLYFHASTTTGQSVSWLDMTSYNQPNVLSSVYGIVLKKDGPNPLGPESDEEPMKEEPKPPVTPPTTPPAKVATVGAMPVKPPTAVAAPAMAPTSIDLEGLDRRVFTLPLPSAPYVSLQAGAPGSVLAFSATAKALATDQNPFGNIFKFDFASRQAMPIAQAVLGFDVSADGMKMVLNRPGGVAIVSTMMPSPPGTGAVDLSGVRAKINPREEWAKMFHLVWRNEKLLMYDPGLHGIDADEMDRRYSPFLANLATREQLNYLFTDMLGELSIGHMFISGGDSPATAGVPGGLLGADYTFDFHRYRISRIYDGEKWNPRLRAPLAAVGVNAKVGEYILAVDGKELTELNDIYETLEGKAGKQVKIKIGPKIDGTDSREVTVVPIPNEFGLRQRAWAEDNRRRVSEATGGLVGYVHVPDTNVGGWTEFNRYYYAQIDKKGMVVDERFNHGGLINNFMVDEMNKTMYGAFTPRYGKDWPTPGASLFGPKVMLINQFAGSGGDMFPWLFRAAKVGPLIGKRTWGGLVASFGFELPDGGVVRAPDCAFYNPNGTWDVEGWGVSPDIDVELDPYMWRQGRDAQLERAIAEVIAQMKTFPYPKPIKPKFRDNTKVDIRY